MTLRMDKGGCVLCMQHVDLPVDIQSRMFIKVAVDMKGKVMRDSATSDRWVTSPRVLTPGRPRSVREVYKPAVQDLSEQATRNGNANQEETILSVVSSCTPRQNSAVSSGSYTDKYQLQSPPSLLSTLAPEETAASAPTTQFCFNHHNNEFHEDLHRQRVLVSAHQRRKLSSVRMRRSQSTPLVSTRPCQQTTISSMWDGGKQSWQTADGDADKLEFVVTNGSRLNEKDFKERVNYRLTNRTKPKSYHPHLVANGTPLPELNGYSQALLKTFPQYTRKYSNWLTNGLKIQSFRSGHRSRDFNHSRPPPPLLQYIHRPKTVSGIVLTNGKKTRPKVDMNVVGIPKEVQKQTLTQGHNKTNGEIGIQ